MRVRAFIPLLLVGFAFAMFAAAASLAFAQDDTAVEPDVASDAYCLLCHSKPDQVWHLPSGETLSLTIDPQMIAQSVHGVSSSEGALACADCHPNFRYPHVPPTSQSAREFRLERYAVCRDCHEDQYTRAQDSVHGAFLRAGRVEAAICVDCHGGHDIQSPAVPRQRISLTCGRCHGAIFEAYQDSVHGSALLDEDNPDVPTCIDCHGVHDIQNPTTTLFRVRSPELCAQCHADAELMGRYGISTHVFESYLSDFHGSTTALFEQQAPEIVTNKAVCYDCHGVHNISAVDDPSSSTTIRATLLTTCQQCHPNASADFSAAWVGHYPATLEAHPVLFLVRRLYDILLPLTIGALIVLTFSGVVRRIRRPAANETGT